MRQGANLTDSNLYEVSFNGSDLRGAVFTNSILSSATFGKDENGTWANLEGAPPEPPPVVGRSFFLALSSGGGLTDWWLRAPDAAAIMS